MNEHEDTNCGPGMVYDTPAEKEIERLNKLIGIMRTPHLYSILLERKRQDEKWGVQNHAPEWWLAILMEEVGELAQAILETHFDKNPEHFTKGGIKNIRKEAVQCAAVAMAMIECIDRNNSVGE